MFTLDKFDKFIFASLAMVYVLTIMAFVIGIS